MSLMKIDQGKWPKTIRIDEYRHGVVVYGDVSADLAEKITDHFACYGWDMLSGAACVSAGATLALTSLECPELFVDEVREAMR